jgi:hypothetical protein
VTKARGWGRFRHSSTPPLTSVLHRGGWVGGWVVVTPRPLYCRERLNAAGLWNYKPVLPPIILFRRWQFIESCHISIMYVLNVGWPTYTYIRTHGTFIVPQLTKQLRQNTTLRRVPCWKNYKQLFSKSTLLCNPKVHYRVPRSFQRHRMPIQTNRVHKLTTLFLWSILILSFSPTSKHLKRPFSSNQDRSRTSRAQRLPVRVHIVHTILYGGLIRILTFIFWKFQTDARSFALRACYVPVQLQAYMFWYVVSYITVCYCKGFQPSD